MIRLMNYLYTYIRLLKLMYGNLVFRPRPLKEANMAALILVMEGNCFSHGIF